MSSEEDGRRQEEDEELLARQDQEGRDDRRTMLAAFWGARSKTPLLLTDDAGLGGTGEGVRRGIGQRIGA